MTTSKHRPEQPQASRSAARDPAAVIQLCETWWTTRDDDAFTGIVEYFTPVLLNLCRKWGAGAEAEDIVQNLFLRVIVSRPAKLGPGLLVVMARHMTIDAGRRKRRESASSSRNETEPAGLDAARHLIDPERWRAAVDCITELTPEQRDVLELIAGRGLSYEAAAQAVGEPLGTVNSRYSRALDRLRKCVKKRLGSNTPENPS